MLVLSPRRLSDARGSFSEVWRQDAFDLAGAVGHWVQDNHAVSEPVGTVRGLHYQVPPAAQAKLVRVGRGAILDVVVDVRRGSSTFGEHLALELSEDRWNQLYVPAGFAHGYCTLEPETHVLYKVSDYYAPEHERGILWCDPALGIDWPLTPEQARVSEKDRGLPPLAEQPDLFR